MLATTLQIIGALVLLAGIIWLAATIPPVGLVFAGSLMLTIGIYLEVR